MAHGMPLSHIQAQGRPWARGHVTRNSFTRCSASNGMDFKDPGCSDISIRQDLGRRLCAGAALCVLSLQGPFSGHVAMADQLHEEIQADVPIADFARVLPRDRVTEYQDRLRALEKDTGFKVRVLSTQYGEQNFSTDTIRRTWSVDEKTVVVFVDPTSPNILSFKFGLEVQKLLSRPFFTELQSRYGNMFYVREEGEAKALSESLEALDICLRKEDGCAVPPGLPSNQYVFTLLCSIAGGAILGAALRLEPQGFVKRQWVYGLLFGPLWMTLSLSYGLGPVVSRTDDPLPVVLNLGATVIAALLIKNYPQAAARVGLSVMSADSDDDST